MLIMSLNTYCVPEGSNIISIMINMEQLPQLSLLILPVIAQNVIAIRNFKFQISQHTNTYPEPFTATRRVSKLNNNQPYVKRFLMLIYSQFPGHRAN